MEVYLIRHTQPDIAKGICYGQSDLGLVNTFSEELHVIKKKIPTSFDAVYSSPLQRCYLLAKNITQKKISLDNRLMELDFGEWEMQAWAHIPQDKLDTWMKDFVHVAVPNGESMLMLQKRVLQWWGEILQHKHSKIAITTHAGVIRVLLAHLRNIPLQEAFSKIKLEYGEVICVEI